jgi:FKBP-type peptidyl-prolyl cis-trans isomerase FklB
MKIRPTPQVSCASRRSHLSHFVLLAVVAAALTGCNKESAAPAAAPVGPALDTDVAKASYGLGYNIAGNVNNQYGRALDAKAFVAGIEDGFSRTDMKVPEDAVLASLNALNEASEKERGDLAARNLAAAKAYLAENAKKEGVTTLPSGLQYEVLTVGTGAKPTVDDTVTTHYTGTLIDGTVFDSSVERGTPASFPVNGVIPGWVEALQLMPVGSKWRLVIPPELAYQERGAGNRIGPNEALIFTVELLSIDPAS